MRQLLAAMKKEMLLLVRDKMGLGILFIMPMVLIFVMTLIQDAAFRALNEDGVPILFVNNDQDTLGNRVESGLKRISICAFNDEVDGKKATADDVYNAVKEGKFIIGIIVPEGATEAIETNIGNMVAQSLGMDDDISDAVDSTEIQLVIDPVATKSFVTSITSSLREFISGVKTRIMFESFNEKIAEMTGEEPDMDNPYGRNQVVQYSEVYASEMTGEVQPNAVQHNVPAWTIFAMFFIVLPLVGSVMKEKEEGTVFRFHTIPTTYFLQITAKLLVFTVVCMIQFCLMLTIGLIFLPMMELPVLDLGQSYAAIVLVAFGCSIAASGYGVVVGTLAGTQQQGAILGSLSILVLSALGGIWVPAYIMPDTMRTISELSPLNWGLDAFYGLFLRGEGVIDVLPHVLKLLTFFFLCLLVTVFIHRLKKS